MRTEEEKKEMLRPKSKEEMAEYLSNLVESLGTKMANMIVYMQQLWQKDPKARVILFSQVIFGKILKVKIFQFSNALFSLGGILEEYGIESTFVRG